MTRPIEEQLRRYATGIVAGIEPVTPTETISDGVRRLGEGRRPAWVFAVAAATLTLAGGLVWILALGGRSVAPATTAPPTTRAIEPTTSSPVPAIGACPGPAPLPGAPAVEPLAALEALRAETVRLVDAVDLLSTAVATRAEFPPGWLQEPDIDAHVLAITEALGGVRDAATSFPISLESGDTLSGGLRSDWFLRLLVSSDGLPGEMRSSLDELAEQRSREDAISFLGYGGATLAPCAITSELVDLVDSARDDHQPVLDGALEGSSSFSRTPEGDVIAGYFTPEGWLRLRRDGEEVEVAHFGVFSSGWQLIVAPTGNPLFVIGGGRGFQVVACADPACAGAPAVSSFAATGSCHTPIGAIGPDGRLAIAYSWFPGDDPLCADHMDRWYGEVHLVKCLDDLCTESTGAMLERIEQLWRGPLYLVVMPEGRVATAWDVAQSGHPVHEVERFAAVCDASGCVTESLGLESPALSLPR